MKKSLAAIIIASLLLGGCASLNCLEPLTAISCVFGAAAAPIAHQVEDSKDRKAAQHQSDEWEKARQQAQPQADTSETPAPVAEEK